MVDLSGLIDLHIHAAVDGRLRYRNGAELASQAAAAGMRGILLKSHEVSTVPLAKELAQQVNGLSVWGGLVLNTPTGGLDPERVEHALVEGAREIWMPTIHAAQRMRAKGMANEGVPILDKTGELLPCALEILRLIARYDAILGTGHLSIPEIRTLVQEARAAGVKRILVTHPESPLVALPTTFQQEIRGPDLFFERCWLSILVRANRQPVSLEQIANEIQETGFESTVLATDFGQTENPPPVEGLRQFIEGLINLGLTSNMIDRMARQNPAWLINP